jgi:hypothetical protein
MKGITLFIITEVKIIIKIIVVFSTMPSFFIYRSSLLKLTLENSTKGTAPLTNPPKNKKCIS